MLPAKTPRLIPAGLWLRPQAPRHPRKTEMSYACPPSTHRVVGGHRHRLPVRGVVRLGVTRRQQPAERRLGWGSSSCSGCPGRHQASVPSPGQPCRAEPSAWCPPSQSPPLRKALGSGAGSAAVTPASGLGPPTGGCPQPAGDTHPSPTSPFAWWQGRGHAALRCCWAGTGDLHRRSPAAHPPPSSGATSHPPGLSQAG